MTEPRTIQDLLKDFAQRGIPTVQREKAKFQHSFGNCEQHGRYPENALIDGVERWNPPGCPTCRKQAHTKALMVSAEISPRFLSCTFENYTAETHAQEHVWKLCREYADNFKTYYSKGRCMILRGNPGTGKNHLSAAIMLKVMNDGFTALRIKANAFLDEYWSKDFSERESWLQRMATVDLLVIDEIGRASNGKAANDAFFRLIDARYEQMMPTIVISNLEVEELKTTLGSAAYDRLREGGGSLLNFNWISSRG